VVGAKVKSNHHSDAAHKNIRHLSPQVRNCWITLGAYGDCCNTLPLVLHDFHLGNRPTMMIAREFAGLLDGVSYCERLVYEGDYSQSAKAADEAQASGKFDNIYLCQCYGTTVERATDSYAKEAWRLVQRIHLWDQLPLVFDRRDRERERLQFEALQGEAGYRRVNPIVLVSRSGRSSPFHDWSMLIMALGSLVEDFNIVDVSDMRLHRFYDMLGLMEKSVALVSTDSGLLHLAQAIPTLPVIALTTHSPDSWHGSPRRGSHVFNCRYDEFRERQKEIPNVIRRIMSGSKINRIVHVYSDFDHRADDAEFRFNVARLSWKREYGLTDWLPTPVHDKTLNRNATVVGEKKPAPFLKDILERGAEIAAPEDIILFTNDDTNFAPNFSVDLKQCMANHDAIWGSRMELNYIKSPPSREEMSRGYKHCGADVFAFRKSWWTKHRDRVPDFLLSFECWDLSLRTLINITGGAEAEGLCAHQIHTSHWHTAEHRECTGNLYNRHLCQKFFSDNRMGWPA
jgi:hypothetical protein